MALSLKTHKFIQTLDKDIIRQLEPIAKERGVSLQDLIRGIIIPDWMRLERKRNKTAKSN